MEVELWVLKNLKIRSDSGIVIDCYNKKYNILSFIILLIDNIWRLFYDLNIYYHCHIYREINKIIYKKCIGDWILLKIL